MLRYLVCFILLFGLGMIVFSPSQPEYNSRYAKALALLKGVEVGPVQRVKSKNFGYVHRRYGPDGLYWGALAFYTDESASCIRCPLRLEENASRISALSYVRLASGAQYIVELRDDNGAVIINRSDVIKILRQSVVEAKRSIDDGEVHNPDWFVAVFLSILFSFIATVCIAGLRETAREAAWKKLSDK